MTAASDLTAKIELRRDGDFVLDVDFALASGQTTALLGPNGSGKSTLVKALAGLLPIDAGSITLAGRSLDAPAAGIFVPTEERGVGVVFQRYLLFEHLDVLDNISFAPVMAGTRRSEARAAAHRWVADLGLDGLESRKPSQLSGGQAQRVAIARALASKPHVLLLDEPLAALDIETKASLRRLLKDTLDAFEGPRLLITHDPVDAFLLAERVLIIEDGKITQAGSPIDLAQRPATPYAAALAGLNLLAGENAGGSITLSDSAQGLATANTQMAGPVLVTINPNAIALHTDKPSGSPRNSWQTTIATVEGSGDITRVTLADPLPLNVDITPGAASSMQLEPGAPVWASIKATEVFVHPS